MGYDVHTGLSDAATAFDHATASLPYGFQVLSSGIERHGVWEWRLLRPEMSLRRYVVFSLTNVDKDSVARDAELHVGAETDRAFAKRVIARSLIGAWETFDFLQTHLPAAAEAALALTEDDLDQLYIQPRRLPPDEATTLHPGVLSDPS